MAKLTLAADEVEVLRDLLESSLKDLSYEIADTDQADFREKLKAKREQLISVLNQLKNSDG